MKAYCLASSSHGNCFILDFNIDNQSVKIMVECGISIKDIYRKLAELNISIKDVKCCLITHAHQDHCKSVDKLSLLNMPIFASKGTNERVSANCRVFIPNQPNKVLNGLYVFPFEVEHDCEGSVGFIIKTKNETVLFVNDHKKWNCNLVNFKFDYVFIECNYDHKVVYAQYYDLKKQLNDCDEKSKREIEMKLSQHERNLNSHCSLAGTIKGLQKLNLKNCKAIFLIHLSDRYANEYRMKNEIEKLFKIKTYVCKKEGGIK